MQIDRRSALAFAAAFAALPAAAQRQGLPLVAPVREPTRFRLIVNAKTAKAIGLAIPKDVLLQASEVLE